MSKYNSNKMRRTLSIFFALASLAIVGFAQD
jgi:hypothetical protein